MKLYRYRPLSELLFKELLHSEIYLATPRELNDPLDLNAQLNFFPETKAGISALAHILSKQARYTHCKIENLIILMDVMSFKRWDSFLAHDFSTRREGIVTKADLFDIISRFYQINVTPVPKLHYLDCDALCESLDRLFIRFFSNSSVACFSECNNDFLMWSHYASGHTGICLEFEVDSDSQDLSRIALLSSESIEGKRLKWTESVRRVKYSSSLSQLNFIEYFEVFDNADDTDLVNLSKSYWHGYAEEIANQFLQKLTPWSHEREWRIVEVSFQETSPEDRILTFERKALTGIYFGARSSEVTQHRIRNIYTPRDGLAFYQCSVDGTRGIVIDDITASSVG